MCSFNELIIMINNIVYYIHYVSTSLFKHIVSGSKLNHTILVVWLIKLS